MLGALACRLAGGLSEVPGTCVSMCLSACGEGRMDREEKSPFSSRQH